MKRFLIVLAAMFVMAACGSECNHENCANQTPTETTVETSTETPAESIVE